MSKLFLPLIKSPPICQRFGNVIFEIMTY